MSKTSAILRSPRFLATFAISTAIAIAVETFLFSMWTLPIIGYRIPYMGAIGVSDYIFVAIFAVVFGIGAALFRIVKQCGAGVCSIGAAGSLSAFLTLLCPICPVFFLAYFGLSASMTAIVPFFWPIRAISIALMAIGIFILWKKIDVAQVPQSKISGYAAAHAALLSAIALLLISNQALALRAGAELLGTQEGAPVKLGGAFADDVAALVTPSSLPFYGPELGLNLSSLENINKSIRKLGSMAPKQGRNPIALSEAEMARYIAIGTEPTITCEFCCSVKTLVRKDGSPTCGCAHSTAMRGTAAYLIRNYPDMSNADISYELVRQKGLYFPVQMQKRMASELSGDASDFTPDIKYLTRELSPSELSRLQAEARSSGFKPTAAPSMVGGC